MNKAFMIQGNTVSEINPNFAVESKIPVGVYNICITRMGIHLEKIGDEFVFPYKIVGLNREEGNMIRRSFMFTDSCKYLLDENDQLDWNKLYGVSFGLFGIHKNSVRFVWRYNPKINKIQIGAYWYLDGYRNWYLLCSVELNQLINFKITFLKDSVVFTVLDDLVPIAKYQLYVDEKTLTKDKYQCGIYFGGNRRAPQNITIIEKY